MPAKIINKPNNILAFKVNMNPKKKIIKEAKTIINGILSIKPNSKVTIIKAR